MKLANYKKFLGILMAVGLLAGCSSLNAFLKRSPTPSHKQITKSLPQPEQPDPFDVFKETQESLPPESRHSDIELIWEIPKGQVETFVLDYGFSKDDLEFEVQIDADSLQKVEHPEFGLVYRYVLKEQPKNKHIFFAISAVQDTGVSERSEVVEVK